MHVEAVPWKHRPPKLGTRNRGEQQRLVAGIESAAVMRENSASLCHRLDDQYAWHHGISGKVAFKMRFIEGDVFVGVDRLFGNTGHPVY